MARMKLRRVHIADTQQFEDVLLDFTHPETGEPLNRVCFIGRNGTGKSTILHWLDQILVRPEAVPDVLSWVFEQDGRIEHARNGAVTAKLSASSNLVAFAVAESSINLALGLGEVPQIQLSEALGLSGEQRLRHEISNAHVADMWKRLVYLVKQRESDRQAYETRPENLEKTKAQLIREFDEANPPVLEALGELWNRILEPTGLVFDVQGAKLPIQLTDNLEAYIQVKATGERIAYNVLSTGIRNFLFHVGHLFLLFFNRTYESAFVLIDEPENSLFPDFLYDLMEIYDALVGPDTQLFIATHNPIVAAQFEPHERIVLEWDETAHVTARRGTAPKGDDPNDVLQQDFHVSQLMGPAGRAAYQRYRQLRKEIRRAPDGADTDAMIEEAGELARAYGFP